MRYFKMCVWCGMVFLWGCGGSGTDPIVTPTPTPTPTAAPTETPTPTPTVTPTPTPTPILPSAGTVQVDCGSGVSMGLVLIPAGSFQMGTAATDYAQLASSRPIHTVTFTKGFYMSEYKVTQAQYLAVMGTNPSHFNDNINKPVEEVTWENAVQFCQNLSASTGKTVRLPSEAEWEYACKADHGNVDTKFFYGDDVSLLVNYAWYNANANNSTHVVGQKTPNSLGLYDMMGNVVEWCRDVWHNTYNVATPTDGSAWMTGGDQSHHVARGGAWAYDPDFCRSAVRYWMSTVHPAGVVGFRVVVEK